MNLLDEAISECFQHLDLECRVHDLSKHPPFLSISVHNVSSKESVKRVTSSVLQDFI